MLFFIELNKCGICSVHSLWSLVSPDHGVNLLINRVEKIHENLLRGFMKLQLLENALSRGYKSLKHSKRQLSMHGKANNQ